MDEQTADQTSRNGTAITEPPGDLPTEAGEFYNSRAELPPLFGPDDETPPNVLERLGPAPFPRRAGFPLIGFLTTLYEHLGTQAGETLTKFRE